MSISPVSPPIMNIVSSGDLLQSTSSYAALPIEVKRAQEKDYAVQEKLTSQASAHVTKQEMYEMFQSLRQFISEGFVESKKDYKELEHKVISLQNELTKNSHDLQEKLEETNQNLLKLEKNFRCEIQELRESSKKRDDKVEDLGKEIKRVDKMSQESMSQLRKELSECINRVNVREAYGCAFEDIDLNNASFDKDKAILKILKEELSDKSIVILKSYSIVYRIPILSCCLAKEEDVALRALRKIKEKFFAVNSGEAFVKLFTALIKLKNKEIERENFLAQVSLSLKLLKFGHTELATFFCKSVIELKYDLENLKEDFYSKKMAKFFSTPKPFEEKYLVKASHNSREIVSRLKKEHTQRSDGKAKAPHDTTVLNINSSDCLDLIQSSTVEKADYIFLLSVNLYVILSLEKNAPTSKNFGPESLASQNRDTIIQVFDKLAVAFLNTKPLTEEQKPALLMNADKHSA